MNDTVYWTIVIIGSILGGLLQGILIGVIFKAVKKWFTDRK